MCLFENGFIIGIVILIFAIVVGFFVSGGLASIFTGDFSPGCGGIYSLLIFIGWIVIELEERHFGHAIFLLSPIILCVAYFILNFSIKKKLKSEVELLIPNYLEHFVSINSFVSLSNFRNSVISDSDLKKYKNLTFDNPKYDKKDENSKITLPFYDYLIQKYNDMVSECFVEDLKLKLPIYENFSYKTLYADMTKYQDFFKFDDQRIDFLTIEKISKPIISNELDIGNFKKTGDCFQRVISSSSQINDKNSNLETNSKKVNLKK